MRVMSVQELFEQSLRLFQQYDTQQHLSLMSRMQEQSLTGHQFAQLIGKTRLYQFLPPKERKILWAVCTLTLSLQVLHQFPHTLR
ncbi:MAG: DUF3871 family protein [Alistipes sp.]|nr:DUF3871 family protein [Alistipes sp.]